MKTNPEFDGVKAALNAEKATKKQGRLARHQEAWDRAGKKLKEELESQAPYSGVKAELDKEFEAQVDRRAARLAKEMQGHVKFFGVPLEENPVLQAANEVFRKARLRKVN
jgi:hypothetical protein